MRGESLKAKKEAFNHATEISVSYVLSPREKKSFSMIPMANQNFREQLVNGLKFSGRSFHRCRRMMCGG